MRKYLFIYKTEIMSNISYAFNLITGFIGYFIHIFIFLNLWKYIYSDPNELINGYSMNQMVWYVIVTEILWMCIGGRKLCKQIINDVRTGNVAYNINRPYSYILYQLFSNLGSFTVKFIMFTILGMTVGYAFLGGFPNLSILSIILVLISSILATIINTLFVISIGLFSFFIEDSNPFYWVYSKFILVLGTLFPIEYFPKVIQPIIKASPIFAVSYAPAKLFVDYSSNNVFYILLIQLIYLFISYMLCTFIYKKGVKNINVNGG